MMKTRMLMAKVSLSSRKGGGSEAYVFGNTRIDGLHEQCYCMAFDSQNNTNNYFILSSFLYSKYNNMLSFNCLTLFFFSFDLSVCWTFVGCSSQKVCMTQLRRFYTIDFQLCMRFII